MEGKRNYVLMELSLPEACRLTAAIFDVVHCFRIVRSRCDRPTVTGVVCATNTFACYRKCVQTYTLRQVCSKLEKDQREMMLLIFCH